MRAVRDPHWEALAREFEQEGPVIVKLYKGPKPDSRSALARLRPSPLSWLPGFGAENRQPAAGSSSVEIRRGAALGSNQESGRGFPTDPSVEGWATYWATQPPVRAVDLDLHDRQNPTQSGIATSRKQPQAFQP